MQYPSIQVSKYPSIQVSKYPSIQVSKYPSIQVSKYLVLASILGFAYSANAATLNFTQAQSSYNQVGYDSTGTDYRVFNSKFSNSGSASSSIYKSVPSPTDADTTIFYAYSTTQSNYGSFNLHSAVDLKNRNGHSYFEESSNCSSCVYSPSASYARFYDTFTITGGTGTGYLRISANVDAAIAASNPQGNLPSINYLDDQGNFSTNDLPGDLEAAFEIVGGNNATINRYRIQNDTTNVVSNLIQFTYNQPFALRFEAVTSIFPGDYIPSTEIYDYSASVGLTVNLANFSVFNDVDGLNQTNFNLTASSGTLYPVSVLTSVPEADSYAMLLAGLGVLGLVARRKKLA